MRGLEQIYRIFGGPYARVGTFSTLVSYGRSGMTLDSRAKGCLDFFPGSRQSHIYSVYESNVFVKELIFPLKQRDVSKLEELLLPYEVESKRISIAQGNRRDARYWKFEKKGHYSIKSSYWNCTRKSPISEMKPGPSSRDSEAKCWSKLWSLRLLPKV